MFNKKPGLGLFVFGLLWIGAIVLFRIGPTYVSSGWPTVIGTVVGSHVGSSSNGEGTTFSPVIAYTYEVMGIEYSSSKVWAGSTPSTSDYSWAQGIVNDYSVGSNIVVYYNPGNPSSSALIVEYDTIDLFFVALGMIFLIIPLIPGGIKDRFRGRNLKTNVTGIPTQTGYSNQNQNDSKLYENTFDEGNRPTEPVTQQISQQFSGSCQNCGNSIKTGAKFCVDCGEKF